MTSQAPAPTRVTSSGGVFSAQFIIQIPFEPGPDYGKLADFDIRAVVRKRQEDFRKNVPGGEVIFPKPADPVRWGVMRIGQKLEDGSTKLGSAGPGLDGRLFDSHAEAVQAVRDLGLDSKAHAFLSFTPIENP